MADNERVADGASHAYGRKRMSATGRAVSGCVGIPLLLIGGCNAKMLFDRWQYELPGPVLASSAPPTVKLASAMDVAESLDSYVQPRFEILRDKNFGAFRIIYRQHAGIVQLKVESRREKELIANVNATKRDYAISLLHCETSDQRRGGTHPARLTLLYYNQQQIATDSGYYIGDERKERSLRSRIDMEAMEQKANFGLDRLLAGREYRVEGNSWDLLMRPVLASEQKCVGCHEGSRRGDTLGVMVYAVRKTPRLVAAVPRPR